MMKIAAIFLCICIMSAVGSSRDADRITRLPGQPPVTFQHYAGYVDLHDKNETSLFYWFIEAEEDPIDKPLVLWLNGGPGASSIGVGQAVEIGPFQIRVPDSILHLNNDSWNRVVNLLFLESPTGVGFSYSNVSDVHDNDLAARNSYEFLLNWFGRFSEYKSSEFYIAGESYAGFYIPELAQVIVSHNKRNCDSFINLRGILLGNPLLNVYTDGMGWIDNAWTRGLIYEKSPEEYNSILGAININNLNAKACNRAYLHCMPPSNCKANFELEYTTCHPCFKDFADIYFGREDVQHALHADRGNKVQPWSVYREDFNKKWNHKTQSVLHVITELSHHKIRIWIYSGDMDANIPVLSTRYSLGVLVNEGMKNLTSWMPWYHEDQVGGWTIVYDQLTFLTVRGAGHLVPSTTPRQAMKILIAFLKSEWMAQVK